MIAVTDKPRLRIIGAVVLAVVAGCSSSSADHSDTAAHNHSLVAAATVMGAPDVVVTGPQGRSPQFVVSCEFSHAAPNDPIVYPGRDGASHMHVFFGNRTTDESSTYENMIGAETSCEQRLDTASYWAPALLSHGAMVEPEKAVAYYRPGFGIDPTTVQPYPPGLMMIAGDAAATEAQPASVVAWSCGVGAEREVTPPECSRDSTLRMLITFPDCWNGVDLDIVGHRDHVHYSSEGVCPASHPVPIPQLTLTVIYPYLADPGELTLASGPIYSGHADFFNSWDQDKLVTEVESCLHREVVCGVSSDRI